MGANTVMALTVKLTLHLQFFKGKMLAKNILKVLENYPLIQFVTICKNKKKYGSRKS